MNFANLKKIKNDLIFNKISQKDYLIYFILSGLPIFSTIVLDLRFNKFYKELNLYTNSIVLLFSIIIIIILYKINKSIDSKNFFERFFSLNFIIRFRLFFLFIIPYIIISLIIKNKFNFTKEKYLIITHFSTFINLILYSIIIIIEFLKLKKMINKNQNTL